MADYTDSAEVTFEEMRMDERFKKLQRTLKLAALKKRSKSEIRNSQTPEGGVSSRMSSINTDGFESSSSAQCMQTSMVGSELVSSSNNLRNILLKKMNKCYERPSISTSSTKKYNSHINEQLDSELMPPPYSMTLYNQNKSVSAISDDCASPFKKPQDYDSSYTRQSECLTYLQSPSIDSKQRKIKVFTKWRVMLNEQAQILIKGTLQCGKVARSKPVMKRLTPTSVESINRYVYHLQGNIVDERDELPSYIRGKFHNGFPDDWENVHLVWQTFVRQGHPLNFHWPTPITDSDDDLNSEITDITLAHVKPISKRGTSRPNTRDVACSCNISDKSPTNLHNSSTQTYISGNVNDLLIGIQDEFFLGRDKENRSLENLSTYNISPKTRKKRDVMKKLNDIFRNVTDKNCSLEYINKIIAMFDCLNYFMSYAPNDSEANVQCETQLKAQCGQNTPPNYNYSEAISGQKSPLTREKSNESMNKTQGSSISYDSSPPKDTNSMKATEEDSDNGTYAGVPKICAERLLKQKLNIVLNPPRHKNWKQPVVQSGTEKLGGSPDHVERKAEEYDKGEETVEAARDRRSVKKMEIETRREVPKENEVSSNVKPAEHRGNCTPRKVANDNIEKLSERQSNNPKMLTAWTPKVVWDPESSLECGLVFEGQLLNEAGHVAHRKFTTDIVCQRLAPKLIETRSRELYQLVGDLHDTKHVIPKKLLSQCRCGCPTRIDQFCKLWNAHYKVAKLEESAAETSVDNLAVSVSSRGRRIVPPLCYWTGERVALKNNDLVYDPGSSQENISFSHANTKKNTKVGASKPQKNTADSRDSSQERSNLDKENIAKAVHKKSSTKRKKRITEPIASSDSDDHESHLVTKRRKSKARGKSLAHPSESTNMNGHNSACLITAAENR